MPAKYWLAPVKLLIFAAPNNAKLIGFSDGSVA